MFLFRVRDYSYKPWDRGTERMSDQWDAIVVGAGAAGLLAAARAAELGSRVILLEKNRKAGVKILISGGTRCNITHDCDARGIVEAFGRNGPFLHSSLAAFSPRDVVSLFRDEGVDSKVEPGGKVFPASDRALDVRDALVRRLSRSGAMMSLGEPAVDIRQGDAGFEIRTSTRTLRSAKLLVTSGGASYPGCGTTGDGYAWARAFGHSIVPIRPALTPLRSNLAWVKELSGLTLPDVRIGIWDGAGEGGKKRRPLDEFRGGFLFTHWGLSGPAPLNVSRAVTSHPSPGTLHAACDFLPQVSKQEFDERLRSRCRQHGKRLASGLLEELPNRLGEALIAAAGVPPDRRLAEMSAEQIAAVAAAVKDSRIPLAGALGFEKAEVTAGGIALTEVDSKTMQSKRIPGLYFAGEILDLDGRIGGYNFQAAFSTGWAAGTQLSVEE
jgi:predicted Rossmann fold flavoprotein